MNQFDLWPAMFPGLMHIRHKPTRQRPPESPWLLDGWIELTDRARPGWRAICETTFDVEQLLRLAPRFALFRATIRGCAIGDRVGVREVCDVALSPTTGRLVVVMVWADRRPRP